MKVDIQSVHFTADQKLIDFIKNKVNKLDRFSERIIDASVVLKLENTGKIQDKVSEISINIPGNKLVSKSIGKNFEQATDEAITQVERQLKKIKGKQIDRKRSTKSI